MATYIQTLIDPNGDYIAPRTKVAAIEDLASYHDSTKQDQLTAGTNITIENNVISATGGLATVTWGGIEGTLSNQEDLQEALDAKANTSAIPTKVSDLTNDSGFVTKAVNDLTNYYLSSNTYTKTEVQNLIDAVKQFRYEVVASLPTASASTMNKIYLVPSSHATTQNVKDEYITIEQSGAYSWEQIGSTTIDLSNYYTKTQTDSAISAYHDSTKQDTISDLTTIRSGAAAGATAVQPGSLATVATSGSYNDLSNTPDVPITKDILFINEDNVTVTTDSTKGVSPYSGSYGYTNITINGYDDTVLEPGFSLLLQCAGALVVASSYRNTRIRFGTDGNWIPVFYTTGIAGGNSYFTAGQIRQIVYSTKTYASGAFHIYGDSNSTYSPQSLGFGYATCATAAATTAKVATLSSYSLVTHGTVSVKFTYAVPANATLNINGKGTKAIYYKGAAITAGVIDAGDIATFIYNGSQYHLLSIDTKIDTQEPDVYLKSASVSGNTLTLTKKDNTTQTFTPTFTEQYLGTVTSVSAGTGLAIQGTSSVNPTVKIANDYKLPTTGEWNGKQDVLSSYVKSTTVSGNTLTLTDKNDNTTTFTPTFTEQYTGTVTSVAVGDGLAISGTASVNPTININSNYKLPTNTEWSGKQDSSSLESDVADKGFTKNAGTVTSVAVKMNGSTKGTVTTSGEIDLGIVITAHQDIGGKEDKSNKVTSLTAESTDTQYPSAKCVYDLVGNVESLLEALL